MSHYVIICGSRHEPDEPTAAAVSEVLAFLHLFYGVGLRVLHGDAPGIDRCAHRICIDRGITVKAYPADWGRGRSAGPERNRKMADNILGWQQLGHSGEVIAFPGGRGTSHMVDYATKLGLNVTEIEILPPEQPIPEQQTLGV